MSHTNQSPLTAGNRSTWMPLTLLPRRANNPAPFARGPKPIIRLLLVDDHPVVIHGLTSCLGIYANLKIVGFATDGEEALRKTKELSPDVVLMDINMPNVGGFDALAALKQEAPAAKVLILTFYDSPEYLLRMLRSGARGYVLKNAPTEDLVEAIEAVFTGDTFFSPHLSQNAMKRLAIGNGHGPQPGDLSDREREVLVAIAEGFSNKEIATQLGITVRTVETHRERLMRKLGIHSIAGLTRFAVQTGMVQLNEPMAVA